MADSADIAVGSSSYLGNAALGNAGTLAIDIDTKPIQQLAQYTFLYNKSLYDQRQKDADEKIKQLAALTAYDLVNGRGKDKQAVIDAQAKLTDYMTDFASKGTPKTPKEKINQQLDFQKQINDSIKIINGANTRAIGYSVQKAEIDKDQTLTAAQKENLIKDLDKTFDDTDIYTPIPALPKFKAPNTDVGTAPIKETAVVKVGDNGFTEEKVKIFDPKTAMNESFLLTENLKLPTLPDNATPLQKQEYEQRVLAGDTNTVWQQAAQNYAAAFNDPNYKKTVEVSDINVTGTPSSTTVTDEVDIEKVKTNNPIVGGILDLVDRWNDYATQMKEQANTVYTDQTGKSIKLLPAVNADDYFVIDKTKPLSPQQIVFLQKFAKHAPDKLEKNYVNTGAANALKLKQIDEAGANYRARLSAATKGDKDNKAIDKPAILFGQHIDRLKKTFSENGNTDIIVQYKAVDDKTRIAAKLEQGDVIVYKPDGSYEVKDSKGKTKSIGTIENLGQGFIDAVKTIDLSGGTDKDGTMAEGFQKNSEAAFNKIFGTTSGKLIWDNWDGGKANKGQTKTESKTTKTINAGTIKSLVGTKGYEGYTEQELIDYYKTNGYDVK